MKEKITEWKNKFDTLEQRERILLIVTAVVVVVMTMQFLLIDPLLAERKKLTVRVIESSQLINQYQAEKQIVDAQLNVGLGRAKKAQLKRLQDQVDELDLEIEESVVAMIPPRLMPDVLERVLLESRGLKLISLANQPVIAIIEQEGAAQSLTSQALYSHSVQLKLSGDYMSVIAFFDKLAELPWRFYWDDLDYQVDVYPRATVTLKVHTVSMSKEWIGV